MLIGGDRQGGVKVGYNYPMKTKSLTFLLALTFLFLFSGSVYGQEEVKKEYWDNGKLKSESHYKDGNLDGRKTDWYEDGKVKSVGYYDNDKLEAKREFWDNSELKSEYSFKDEKLDGVKREFWDNGELKSVSNYKDGKLNGKKTEWYEDGEVKSVNYYYNSKLLEIKKRDHLDNDELVEFVDYRSWLGQPSYDGAKGLKEIEKVIL